MIRIWSALLLIVAMAGAATGQDHGRGYVYPSAAQRKVLHAEAYKAHGYRQHYQVVNMTAPPTWDSRALGWIPPIRDQGNCFPAGTKILMGDYTSKNIEQLKPGDKIINAHGGAGRVKFVRTRDVSQLAVVSFVGWNDLICTDDHPVLTKRGWIEAKDLRDEDWALSHDLSRMKWVRVSAVRIQHSKKSVMVYDLYVGGDENSYVASGIGVHNCGDCFGVSASDALTITYIKNGYQKADGTFVISEQYGLDYRNAYQGGCNGGDGPQVYDYFKATGFPAEKYLDTGGKAINDYPAYTARPGPQRLKAGTKMWGLGDLKWGYVTANQSDRAPTVGEVKAGIMSYANVTFAFDAGGLSNMVNNVVRKLGNNIDHEITGFIGWDDNKACPDGTKGAFLCRNQWSGSFGDGGYFWLPYSQLPRVVEACFLTVAPLTPPPPIPVPIPPDPTPVPPIGGLAIVFPQDVRAGTYYLTTKARADEIAEKAVEIKTKIDALQKLLDEIKNGAQMSVEPVPEVKKPMPEAPPQKLPPGPEKEPDKKPEAKSKPKVIEGVLHQEREAVAGLQAKVKAVERSRNVVVSVSHEFDVSVASADDLHREREWLTRRLEAMSKP